MCYPSPGTQTRHAKLDKWKIPSCIPCNRSLGVMEDVLFV
jgi:hypothetical protein